MYKLLCNYDYQKYVYVVFKHMKELFAYSELYNNNIYINLYVMD